MSTPFNPQPKPRRIVLDRLAEKRERDQKATRFRNAVWARDGGICRHCGRKVFRTLDLILARGEVHHRRGRNVAPEDRYNVDEAVLLCTGCHGDPDVIQQFRRTA